MAGHWIADSLGTFALVDTDADRDLAIGQYGWRAAGEPGPADQVRIVLGEMNGRVPYAALAADGDWARQGWKPGPPPELPAREPEKPTPAATAKKES